jgi:hypothetical protein
MGRTIESAGQHIMVLALPTDEAIVSCFRELVKVRWTPRRPTSNDQQNPIKAAMDRAVGQILLLDY